MAIYDSQTQSKSTRNSRRFRDIDLDFTRNAVTNDVNVVEDVIAVKRSVRNLVQTNFYERPFNPELGCGVRELLFEPFTPLTKVHLERKIEDVIAVKRAVKNLVQTNFYERPFQPELGCGIRELLFENFTPMTKVFLENKITEVLLNFEPRIDLNSVRVDDDQDNNRLIVDIYFYVVGVPGPQTVQTFLQRLR